MRKATIEEGKKCPNCGRVENQIKIGYNRSGTQRCRCKECGTRYTIAPKERVYSEEIRESAIKMFYAGASGRQIGQVFGMSKANVYNWIKNGVNVEKCKCAELDELYWFVERKGSSETRENVYILLIVSRSPRMIVGFDVAFDKSSERIQRMVDAAPPAEIYCSDGYWGYLDIVYPGKYIRNIRDKSDTFTVESVNADLRHYIPLLARRSRCFSRKLDTLRAVLEVFVDAYNQFGLAKYRYRLSHPTGEIPCSLFDFL